MTWQLIALFIVVLAIVIASILFERFMHRVALRRSLRTVLFRVSLPRMFLKESEQQKASLKERIAAMEQLLFVFSRMKARGFLNSLLGPPHATFELAVPAVGEEIAFYLAVSKRFSDEVEKGIHGVYDTANVERIADYNIFHPYGVAAGTVARLQRHFALPLRTYMVMETDPLQSLATSLSKLAIEGEGASLQILLRPAPRKARRLILRIARQMQKSGHEFDRSRREVSFWWQLFRLFFHKPPPKQFQRNPQAMMSPTGMPQMPDPNRPWMYDIHQPLTPLTQETVKAVEGKASKPLFAVNVRLFAGADQTAQAEDIVEDIKTSFSQFDSPQFNSFRFFAMRGRALRKLAYQYAFRLFDPKAAVYLNSEELTSLFHLPNTPLETPKVKFVKAKPAAPPPNMPKEGLALGTNTFRGMREAIRMALEDRRRHLYVVGQTGTGKTTLLQQLISQDMQAGNGVAVIDPHGDLAENTLALVPPERAEDVVYFDAADVDRPMGLNILEWQTEDQKDFAVQEMIRIFEKLFPPEIIGPMFEHNMRNAMLTLMADKEAPGTIVEIPRIFTDEAFARAYVAKVTDPLVRAFWEKEMAKTTEFHKSEMLGYLVSKVGRFVENAMMRNIIGQAHSSFNIRDIMDSGKIFIANLSKGKLGEVNSSLLGLVLVGKMQMAALARADMAEYARKDFFLYIDEFQSFTTDSIATILSEARKYRLNLTLAHQFIAQLPDSIREAVFGNVGSLVSFRVGAKDAEFLVKQFAPIFTEQDLVNVDNFNAYAKLMIHGVAERPFTIELQQPVKGDAARFAALRELSRSRFGRPRNEVEAEIMERSRLAGNTPPKTDFIPGERNA